MRISFYIVSFSMLLFVISACNKVPVACFEIKTPIDSIRVGKNIEFDAACSIDAQDYFWDFSNGLGGNTEYIITQFDTAGTYNVTLVAARGSKTQKNSKDIIVKP
jgi:hypothetical protein